MSDVGSDGFRITQVFFLTKRDKEILSDRKFLSDLTGCPTQVSDFTSSTVITFGTSSKL